VRSALAGVSRVLTRRWLFGVTGSRSTEHGYLTDPYKVISVLDSTGAPVGLLTDSRPSSRTRQDLLASSVVHLTRDILYASYRSYWDDWGVTSHTADARYRLELSDRTYVQPHVRYYFQGRANFFQFGLPQDAPLPAYATSDTRLGDLRTLTLGATYGFHPAGGPGEGEKAGLARPGRGRVHRSRNSCHTRNEYASITVTACRWNPDHSRPWYWSHPSSVFASS
jgi:hypothetical protein